jgi:hypothetical protein
MMATTAERGSFVRDLISSCREGSESLSTIPQLVRVIIEDEMWKGFYIEEMDKISSHDDFETFITANIPEGLETTVKVLKGLCWNQGDTEVADMIDEAIQRKVGNPDFRNKQPQLDSVDDNIEEEQVLDEFVKELVDSEPPAPIVDIINDSKTARPTGTSRDQGLRRLRKDRPDLHKDVIEGDKSVHKAMVEAGFRKIPDPVDIAKKNFLKMSDIQRDKFIEWASSQ